MKKSELRKLIKEVISEQIPASDPFGAVAPKLIGPFETNLGDTGTQWGGVNMQVKCPEGYHFATNNHQFINGPNGDFHRISGCVRIKTVAKPVKGLDTGTSGPYQVD